MLFRSGEQALVLVINPKVPAANAQEFLQLARSKPGTLTFAGSDPSTILATDMLRKGMKADIVTVPYKGAGQALIDVIGGQLQMIFAAINSGLPYANAGKLNALAITTSKRSSVAPSLPTIAESGVPRYEFSSWYGFLVPKGTPRAIIDRLNSEVRKALAQPDFRERLTKEGSEPIGGTPEAFAAYLKTETAQWADVVKATGLKME